MLRGSSGSSSGAARCARTADAASRRTCRRPCLEAHVRDRVRALPNVSIQDQCEVAGLVTTPARDRVTGARVLPRAGGDGPEILAADLVVDATGRGGRTAAWLKEIGYDPPAEEQLRVDIKYATGICGCAPARSGTRS